MGAEILHIAETVTDNFRGREDIFLRHPVQQVTLLFMSKHINQQHRLQTSIHTNIPVQYAVKQ